MYKNVLCVCLGNICRSSIAEAVLRKHFADSGLQVYVDSAGLEPWLAGQAPDARGIVAARLRGYDMSGQTARAICHDDFDRFDLILAVDKTVLEELLRIRPHDSTAQVQLFTDCGGDGAAPDIPNPYYTGQFDPALDLIEWAAAILRRSAQSGVKTPCSSAGRNRETSYSATRTLRDGGDRTAEYPVPGLDP